MSNLAVPTPVAAWHALVEARDPAGLDDLLSQECVFHSPALHTPQEGKALTTAYLSAAIRVLGPTMSYHREWYAADSAVLEFRADLEGRTVHGVDMLAWGPDGRLTDFTVMVRPFTGLQRLMERMVAELSPDRAD